MAAAVQSGGMGGVRRGQGTTRSTTSMSSPSRRAVHRATYRRARTALRLETGSKWPARSAVARVAYTFARYRFVSDSLFSGNEIPGAPRHHSRRRYACSWPASGHARARVGAYRLSWTARTPRHSGWATIGLRAEYDGGVARAHGVRRGQNLTTNATPRRCSGTRVTALVRVGRCGALLRGVPMVTDDNDGRGGSPRRRMRRRGLRSSRAHHRRRQQTASGGSVDWSAIPPVADVLMRWVGGRRRRLAHRFARSSRGGRGGDVVAAVRVTLHAGEVKPHGRASRACRGPGGRTRNRCGSARCCRRRPGPVPASPFGARALARWFGRTGSADQPSTTTTPACRPAYNARGPRGPANQGLVAAWLDERSGLPLAHDTRQRRHRERSNEANPTPHVFHRELADCVAPGTPTAQVGTAPARARQTLARGGDGGVVAAWRGHFPATCATSSPEGGSRRAARRPQGGTRTAGSTPAAPQRPGRAREMASGMSYGTRVRMAGPVSTTGLSYAPPRTAGAPARAESSPPKVEGGSSAVHGAVAALTGRRAVAAMDDRLGGIRLHSASRRSGPVRGAPAPWRCPQRGGLFRSSERSTPSRLWRTRSG